MLLSVRDEGPGIPPDEIEAVFDKFVQSSKTKSNKGGTGLGPGHLPGDCRRASRANLGGEQCGSGAASSIVELPR